MQECYLNIIASAQTEVVTLLSTQLNPKFVFHNLTHTIQVVELAQSMAGFYQLNEEEKFILIIAAWFHDTGFTTGRDGHEARSITIAQSFLKKHFVGKRIITKVSACIQATKMPQQPSTAIENVLCDADLFHLGSNNFKERTALLRQEIADYYNTEIAEKEWALCNIKFLKSHHYFTAYCQQMLEPVKQQLILKLEKIKTHKEDKHLPTIV